MMKSVFKSLRTELELNVFVKPNEQNDACINSAMARKGGCEETNVFVKPNEQNDTCINSAMARKGGCEETKELRTELELKDLRTEELNFNFSNFPFFN
ncbi:MAG: hypothetical protein IKG75_07070, partial [Bacteroidaceae bacterium]|nr:hypothetical protein [Bacteroidaceae bacterium]